MSSREASPLKSSARVSRGTIGPPRQAARGSGRLSSSRGALTKILNRISTILVAAIVAVCPLPLGSIDPFWVAVWSIVAAIALVTADLRQVSKPHLVMLGLAIATLAVFGLVILLQLMTWPSFAHPVWEQASILLGRPLPGSVTVNPVATLRALGHPLLITLAFCSAFLAAIDRDSARIITTTACYSGAAYAVIGLYQAVFDPGSLLWIEKLAYTGDLTGSFVNRNTAATYFGACLILWMVRLVSELIDPNPSSSGRSRLKMSASALLTRELAVNGFGVFVCASALMLTHSRAGILFTALAVVVTLFVQLRGLLLSGRRWLLACAGLVLAAGLVLEMLGGGIALRIGVQGLVDRERLLAYASALSIVPEFPWLGTGLGTFAEVFPIYRTGEMSSFGLWDRAHNVPLELTVELGLPMTAAIVTAWIGGLVQLLRGALASRRDVKFPLAGFGIGLLGCLHSLVDFSPQIPGFSVFWVSLLAVGLARSVRRNETRPQPDFAVTRGTNASSQPRSRLTGASVAT